MVSQRLLTAASLAVISCDSCHLLCRDVPARGGAVLVCPRCGAELHRRKPHSIARTCALILAAYLLYIPANVLPIMHSTSLGYERSDTIISGVNYLIISGMWPLALVVFFASILVPLLKLVVLTYLLVSVQRRSRWRPKDRARLYRITEGIGRWSMVDIYVVTILVALVQLGSVAKVEAASGAIFFAAVVVLTMFAAMTFDPRLIWDGLADNDD